MDWLNKYDLDQVDDVVIFGVGNGEAYNALKGWLHEKPTRLLIFVEENLNAIGFDSALLSDNLVEVLKLTDESYYRLMWLSFNRRWRIISDPKSDPEKFLKFKAILLDQIETMKWLGLEYSSYSMPFYFNFYQTLKLLPLAYEGVDLFGKAKNVPAVIVGSGPSLNKNGHQLKKLHKKALLFAGGSSLSALNHLGIKPDFGGAIDPNATEVLTLQSAGNIDYPFLFCSRIYTDALKLVKGGKIYVPGSIANDTVAYLLDRLKLKKADFKDGLSVVHFLTQMAVHMGCNPIIYVGLDLSFTHGESNAKGVHNPISSIPDNAVEELDIFGQKVLTRPIWIQEKRWLSQYALEHPNVRFINATEGGLAIDGIENSTLEGILNDNTTIPVFSFKKLPVNLNDIEKEVKILKESLERLLPLLEEMGKDYKRLKATKKENFALPEKATWELRLNQEIAYVVIIKRFELFFSLIIQNSHLTYIIQRDGLNASTAKTLIDYHIQKVDFLTQAVLGQIQIINLFYSNETSESQT